MATKEEKHKVLKKHVEAKKKKKKTLKDLKNVGKKGASFTLFGKKPMAAAPAPGELMGGMGDNLGTKGVF